MIDHTSVSVSDYTKAKEFYTKALAPLGYELVMDMPEYNAAGFGEKGKPDFWIGSGESGGSSVHVAFLAKNQKMVEEFYESAMAAGGIDNGKPGPRKDYHPGYYAAFVKDADGNNIEAVIHDYKD